MSKAQRHIVFRPFPRGLSVRRRVAGAFTLLELLVSIAIIVILAAGVAAIFAAVGDTVSAGKRVSTVNKYSILMEGVIREDFERLTRDGFLVIRHELANDGGLVSQYRGDPNSRPRRIDEVMFFARGDFTSVRRPMTPGITARSNEARVYIGMGKRAIEDLTTLALGTYLYPSLDDQNYSLDAALDAALGATVAGVENPNRFASDWTLVRHVTLLVPPAAGEARTPSDDVFDIDPTTLGGRNRLRDSEWQIGMQPAAQSIFRARMEHWVTTRSGITQFPRSPDLFRDADHNAWPRFSSGLVDVASETLAEIRSVVTSAGQAPFAVAGQQNYFLPMPMGAFDPRNIATRDHARKWMLNAMPGEMTDMLGDVIHPGTLSRIRYEATPPLLMIPDANDVPGGVNSDRERAYREADQEMLAASAFIPRCTEFIVEWSFGWTNNNLGDPRFGQLVWHGLDRVEEDIDGDGSADLMNQRDRVASLFRPGDVSQGPNNTQRNLQELIRIRELVVGLPVDQTAAYQESVFGYYDPGMPLTEDDDVWPWPTLIRITMSFADPTDPTIETTTQFVIEVPDER